jgi:NTE family protein
MAGFDSIETPLVDGLGAEERARLATHFARRAYPAGSMVIRQGEPCQSLFVVEAGSLAVGSVQRGHLASLGPGECLGEISLFTGEPASATVTAVTDAVLLEAPQAELRSLVQNEPVLARNLCRLLSRRLARTGQRSERSVLVVLAALQESAGVGFAINLAASLGYHLQQDVALVDAFSPAPDTSARPAPTYQQPPQRLTVIRSSALAPEQLAPLADSLARQCRFVLVWAPEGAADRLAALRTVTDRVLLAVPYATCRQIDYRPWQSAAAAPELVVLGAPEPRSVAMAEAIEGATGLRVLALLPELPAALRPASVAPDWVLRHRATPFGGATARLARRLLGRRVGLALGAGAGRGHAHVGVLSALERLGVFPDLVAGASIGAGVGSIYAYGVSLHEIELMLRQLGQFIRQRTMSVYSLLSGAGLDRAFRSAFPADLRIEDLPLPCAIVAVDLRRGEEVVLRTGSVWRSVRASASVPGIFPPARLDGRLLVDGALVSPIPCRAAAELGADVVLGVSLETAPGQADQPPGDGGESGRGRRFTVPAMLLRAIDVQQQALTYQCLRAADVPLRVFSPPTPLTDFRGGPELIAAGERAVESARARLQALLPWVRG